MIKTVENICKRNGTRECSCKDGGFIGGFGRAVGWGQTVSHGLCTCSKIYYKELYCKTKRRYRLTGAGAIRQDRARVLRQEMGNEFRSVKGSLIHRVAPCGVETAAMFQTPVGTNLVHLRRCYDKRDSKSKQSPSGRHLHKGTDVCDCVLLCICIHMWPLIGGSALGAVR